MKSSTTEIRKQNKIRYCVATLTPDKKYTKPLKYTPREPEWLSILSTDTSTDENIIS